MKRIITLAAAALLVVSQLFAQQYDALDQVRQDWRKAAGMEGPHRFEVPAPTPAPKGYKPFYIGHYGRHGSRYAWDSDTYKYFHEVLTEAHKDGALTQYGEGFYAKYEDFYTLPLINTGDLVELGFEQHKKLAQWYYAQFPKVFKGARNVNALASTSQRAIVSMGSFCMSLKGCNPALDIYEGSNHAGMCIIAPSSAPSALARKFEGADSTPDVEPVVEYQDKVIDYKGILGHFFKDIAYIDEFEGGRNKFASELYSLLGGYRNYTEPIFDDAITTEQMAGLWEALNYYSYHVDLTARYKNIPLLEDFIAKGNAAINDPTKAADLRFGHDYVVEAFLTLINANGCGTIPAQSSDVKYWFQSYNIPMAATIAFVLYKDKKGDVLFKLMLNEEEVSLPQLQSVQGPYYKWSDFCAWAEKLKAEHPEVKPASK